MSKPKSCILICLQRSHDPLPLPDGVPVIIGRSPQTRIIDPRCSRSQVELISNWSKRKVKVKQLAANNTSIDGSDIGQSKEAELIPNSTLFVLSGQYPHQVVFEDNSSDNADSESKIPKGSKGKNETSSAQKTVKNSNQRDAKVKTEKKSVKRSHSEEDQYSDSKKKKVESQSIQMEKIVIEKDKDNDRFNHKSESASKVTSSKPSKSSASSCHQEMKERKVENIDEETERVKSLEQKLKRMKQSTLISTGTSSKTSSPNASSQSQSALSLQDKSPDIPTPKSSKNDSSCSKKTSEPTSEAAWTSHERLYVFTSKGVEHSNKIVGFDIDGTIIVTKSGKTFPTDSSDWRIAHAEIFAKLKSLRKEGYKIVFFTNQLGVARGKVKIDDLKTKIENIISHLHIPVQVFIATNIGKYRKPMDGMWRKLKSQYNGGIGIDLKLSVYVGDAAGRPADWEPKKKKDFSCSDRLFALNIRVNFFTPEEYFLNHKPAKFNMPQFDPRALPAKGDWVPKDTNLTVDSKEIILLVGYPACGKSHFAKTVLKPKGYVVVNRDTLGTWQKCVKMTQQIIVNSSVVVDNTNLTQEERARYIKCAEQENVPCRCFHFTASIDHCRHNERFREMTDKSHAIINEMIFNKIKTTYQEPKMSEGFTEIVKVSFVPKFSSSSLEADYRKFLLEK